MANDMNEQMCDLAQPTPLPAVTVPAMAYVPYQQFSNIYTPEQGFDNGTIFPELNKPFYGRRGEPSQNNTKLPMALCTKPAPIPAAGLGSPDPGHGKQEWRMMNNVGL